MGGIRCKDILEIAASVYNVRLCETPIGESPKSPVSPIISGAVPPRAPISSPKRNTPKT